MVFKNFKFDFIKNRGFQLDLENLDQFCRNLTKLQQFQKHLFQLQCIKLFYLNKLENFIKFNFKLYLKINF